MTFLEVNAIVQTLLPGVPVVVVAVFSVILWLHLRAVHTKPMTPDALSRRLAEMEDDIRRIDGRCDDLEDGVKNRLPRFESMRDQVTILWNEYERKGGRR